MKHRIMGFTNMSTNLPLIAHALNLLTKNNRNIKFCSDIDDIDAKRLHLTLEKNNTSKSGKEKSITNLMRTIGILGLIFDFLMSSIRNKDMKSPVPHQNPFNKFVFVNDQSIKRTQL